MSQCFKLKHAEISSFMIINIFSVIFVFFSTRKITVIKQNYGLVQISLYFHSHRLQNDFLVQLFTCITSEGVFFSNGISFYEFGLSSYTDSVLGQCKWIFLKTSARVKIDLETLFAVLACRRSVGKQSFWPVTTCTCVLCYLLCSHTCDAELVTCFF